MSENEETKSCLNYGQQETDTIYCPMCQDEHANNTMCQQDFNEPGRDVVC